MFSRFFHHPTVAALANWLGVATVFGGLLGWLLSRVPQWTGAMTWQQIVLLGFASSVVTLLALATTAALTAHALRLLRSPKSIVAQIPTERASEVNRALEACKLADGSLDYPRLRIEMDRITNPNREYEEAFDKFANGGSRPGDQVLRTFFRLVGETSTRAPQIVRTGLAIAANRRLANVRVYMQNGNMASGWGRPPPHWTPLSERKMIYESALIQAGEIEEILLIERDWAATDDIILAGESIEAPSIRTWPYRRLVFQLSCDDYQETRELVLFAPGYQPIMLVDIAAVPLSRSVEAGPVTLNDPLLR